MFFSAYCQEARGRVLLDANNFMDLRYGPAGIELHYRCHCGRTGIVYTRDPDSARCID